MSAKFKPTQFTPGTLSRLVRDSRQAAGGGVTVKATVLETVLTAQQDKEQHHADRSLVGGKKTGTRARATATTKWAAAEALAETLLARGLPRNQVAREVKSKFRDLGDISTYSRHVSIVIERMSKRTSRA